MLLASFKLNDGRLRNKRPVLEKNKHTILVPVSTKVSRFSKPFTTTIKLHVIKDNVTLMEGESSEEIARRFFDNSNYIDECY